tara:strand:- start:11303 stop:23383 length:12081 start_codon:yes stop_codon:yes gene_type:complete
MAEISDKGNEKYIKNAAQGGVVNPIWQADGTPNPKHVFKINDVVFEIPPQNITVHKEDLVYQYKTLRTSSSTKIQSGHGVCHVSINAVFTPDLLLHLHRLIVQFRHSPFCYVENRFLRDSIVPTWPVFQNMAFTMTSLNVHAMPKNPGSFHVEIELRWFNYFPYATNYLFRDEWKTLPMDVSGMVGESTDPRHQKKNLHWDVEAADGAGAWVSGDSSNKSGEPALDAQPAYGCATIPMHQRRLKDLSPVLPYTSTDNPDNVVESLKGAALNAMNRDAQKGLMVPPIWSNEYIGDKQFISKWSNIIQSNVKKATYTLEDMYNAHIGTVFDLQPLPSRMMPAVPVQDPSYSRIYVRYINCLQMQALADNFNIDIAEGVNFWARANTNRHEYQKNPNDYWADVFMYGKYGGKGLVSGIHTGALPSEVRSNVIRGMLTHTHKVYFYWDQYKSIQYQPQMAKYLKIAMRKIRRNGVASLGLGGSIDGNVLAIKKVQDAPDELSNLDTDIVFNDFDIVVDDSRQPERFFEIFGDFYSNELNKNTRGPWKFNSSLTHEEKTGWFLQQSTEDGKTYHLSPYCHPTSYTYIQYAKDERSYLKWYPPVASGRIITPTSDSADHDVHCMGAFGKLTFGSIEQRHSGIDIKHIVPSEGLGMPVFAIEDGVITSMEGVSGSSHMAMSSQLTIQHSNINADLYLEEEVGRTYQSIYKGLDPSTLNTLISLGGVGVNRAVRRGQLIGFVGDSFSNEPFLHLEIHKNGVPVDPWKELKTSLFEMLCDNFDPADLIEAADNTVTDEQITASIADEPPETSPLTEDGFDNEWEWPDDEEELLEAELEEQGYDPEDPVVALQVVAVPWSSFDDLYMEKAFMPGLEVLIGKEDAENYKATWNHIVFFRWVDVPPEGIDQYDMSNSDNFEGLWIPVDGTGDDYPPNMLTDLDQEAENVTQGKLLYFNSPPVELNPETTPQYSLDNYQEDIQEWPPVQNENYEFFVDAFRTDNSTVDSEGNVPSGDLILEYYQGSTEEDVPVYFNASSHDDKLTFWDADLAVWVDDIPEIERAPDRGEAGKTLDEYTPPEAFEPPRPPFDFELTCDKPKEGVLPIEAGEFDPNDPLSKLSDKQKKIVSMLSMMQQDGWSVYEGNIHLTNIWQRPVALTVDKHNFQYEPGTQLGYNTYAILSEEDIPGASGVFPKYFSRHGLISNEGVILTGSAGGLRHIVATIPILGHEFPTHQHLGSIEPTYSLEFTAIDKTTPGGDGLGSHGAEIEAMRAELQTHSRSFRGIPDGSNLCCDTFMTRLFGSYTLYDMSSGDTHASNSDKDFDQGDPINQDRNAEGNLIEGSIRLYKRSIISSMTTSTVEGHPGTSIITMQIEETNPHDTESLTSVKPQGITDEESYSSVLNALINMTHLHDEDDGHDSTLESVQGELNALSDARKMQDIIHGLGYTAINKTEAEEQHSSWWNNDSEEEWEDFLKDDFEFKDSSSKVRGPDGGTRILTVFRSDEKYIVDGKPVTPYIKPKISDQLDEDDMPIDARAANYAADLTYTSHFSEKVGLDIVSPTQNDPDFWSYRVYTDPLNMRDPRTAEQLQGDPVYVSMESVKKFFSDMAVKHEHWFTEDYPFAFEGQDSDGDDKIFAIDLTKFYESNPHLRVNNKAMIGMTGNTMTQHKAYYLLLRKIQKMASFMLAESSIGGIQKELIYHELFEVKDTRKSKQGFSSYAFEGNMYKNFLLWIWMYMFNYYREGIDQVGVDPIATSLLEGDLSTSYLTDVFDPDYMFDMYVEAQRSGDHEYYQSQMSAHFDEKTSLKSYQDLIARGEIDPDADWSDEIQQQVIENMPEWQGTGGDKQKFDDNLKATFQRMTFGGESHLKGIDISDVFPGDRYDMERIFSSDFYTRVGILSKNDPIWTQLKHAFLNSQILEHESRIIAAEAIVGTIPFRSSAHSRLSSLKQRLQLRVIDINKDITQYVEEYIYSFIGPANNKTGLKKAFVTHWLPFAEEMLTPGHHSGSDGDWDASNTPKYFGVNSNNQFGLFFNLLDTARWAMMPSIEHIERKALGDAGVADIRKWEQGTGDVPWSRKQREFAAIVKELANGNSSNQKKVKSSIETLRNMGAGAGFLQDYQSEASGANGSGYNYTKQQFDSFQGTEEWNRLATDNFSIWDDLVKDAEESPNAESAGALVLNTKAWQEYKGDQLEPQAHWKALKANPEWEKNKLNHIKRMLMQLGEALRNDTEFMARAGLAELHEGIGKSSFAGNELGGMGCYPDLRLPPHPYYPISSHAVSPDFYMWSVYEDAPGWLRGSLVKAASDQGFALLKGCWDHLNKMQGSGIYKHNELLKTVGAKDEYNRSDSERSAHIQKILSSSDRDSSGTSVKRVGGFTKLSGSFENSSNHKSFIYDQGDKDTTWVEEKDTGGPLGKELKHLENFADYGPSITPFRQAGDQVSKEMSFGGSSSPPLRPGERNFLMNSGKGVELVPLDTSESPGSKIRNIQGEAAAASYRNVEAFFKERMDYFAKKKDDGSLPEEDREKWEAAYEQAKDEFESWNDNLANFMMKLPPLSITDGSPQYQMRAQPSDYVNLLQKKFTSMENMFGSRAGYLGTYMRPGLEEDAMDDTAIAALDSYTHGYDTESLKRIAESSSVDILSEKLTMKRAYPTFKLYFVEEDEMQSRWLNLDDFYSYNAVKEFTVHRSRKIAADTAVITLQNISGTLDGTKRDVITDLDYLAQNKSKEVADKLETLRGKSRSKEGYDLDIWDGAGDNALAVAGGGYREAGSQDTPFGALVMRPGLNVQLRCGYSNDPEMLEVMLSGRVTDIAWNQPGDMCEITVQSFGAELTRIRKGLDSAYGVNGKQLVGQNGGQKDDWEFPTTHHLLGTLMLSPELEHFGRWEHGRLFQTGEAKDAALDFYDYTRKSPWGMDAVDFMSDFVQNNWAWAFGASVLLDISMFVPGTAAIRGGIGAGASFISRGLARAGGSRVWGAVGNAMRSTRLQGIGLKIGTGYRNVVNFASEKMGKMGMASWLSSNLAEKGSKYASGGGFLPWMASWRFGRSRAYTLRNIITPHMDDLLKEAMRIRSVEALRNIVYYGVKKGDKIGNITAKVDLPSILQWAGGRYAVMGAGKVVGASDDAVHAAQVFLKNNSGIRAWFGRLFKGTQAYNSVHGMDVLRQTGFLIKSNPLAPDIRRLLYQGVDKFDRVAINQALNLIQQQARLNSFGYLTGIAGGGWQVLRANGISRSRIAASSLGGLITVAPGMAIRRLILLTAGLEAVNQMWDRVLSPMFSLKLDKYRRAYVKAKTFYMLSPQDDNLFPPSPVNYMVLSAKTNWDSFVDVTTNTLGMLLSVGTLGMWTDDDTESVQEYFKKVSNPPIKLLDKKLTMREAKYTLYNSTIWDVFHEMSLRHPGHIYGCRPYGKKFEYRMFFGIPSQRYWARPASNGFVRRMNTLRNAIEAGGFGHGRQETGASSATGEIGEEMYKQLYGDDINLDAINKKVWKLLTSTTSKAVLGGIETGQTTIEYDDFVAGAVPDGIGRDVWIRKVAAAKSQLFATRILKEYLTGLQTRFEPFRRYHALSDKTDIISNNIISSEHNVINAVDVTHYDWRASQRNPKGSTIIKAQSFIPDSELNMASVNYPNCKGYRASLRYGQGALLHTMRDMYRGSIMILGNPRIRPWDVCLLEDEYNDMAGPVEVEAVTHLFSHETGFVTEIKPSALVTANEMSTLPVLEAMKAYQMLNRERLDGKFGFDVATLANAGPSTSVGLGITAMMSDDLTLWQVWKHMGSDDMDKWREYLENRYGKGLVNDGEDISNLYGSKYREGEYRFGINGETLSRNKRMRELGPSAHMHDPSYPTYIRPTAMFGMGLGALLAAGVTRRLGMNLFGHGDKLLGRFGKEAVRSAETGLGTKIGSSMIQATGGLLVNGFAATAGYYGGKGAYNTERSLFRSEDYQPTSPSFISWLVSGPILFAKCMEEDVIQIVPLTMNGRPMISGLTTRDPILQWKNKVGDMVNTIADTIDGTYDVVRDFKAEGYSFWRSLGTYWSNEETGLLDDE